VVENAVVNDALVEERRATETSPDIPLAQKVQVASQWQLIRWRFIQHRLAVVSLFVLGVFYFAVAFAEFVAPYNPEIFIARLTLAPPHRIHFVDTEGRFHIRPFVYRQEKTLDKVTYIASYIEDETLAYPLGLFVHGDPYKLWGLFESDIHLFGMVDRDEETRFSLLGQDTYGRDLFSRIVYGTRISLTIGLVGVAMSFILGVTIGGLSGYLGGQVDLVIQRVLEALRAIPTLPLWMGLSVALPADWPLLKTYFAIVIILSIVGWTTIAREVRGRFLSLREEDFVGAAELDGASNLRVIFRYLLPSFMSFIIARLTLAIPSMILGETALSFIGLGLQPPAISWGVLLRDAQAIRVLALSPWLLLPAVFIVISILAFNFVGDGLRDAADPYGHV
jgi:peptide/nickel transport system permease protein